MSCSNLFSTIYNKIHSNGIASIAFYFHNTFAFSNGPVLNCSLSFTILHNCIYRFIVCNKWTFCTRCASLVSLMVLKRCQLYDSASLLTSFQRLYASKITRAGLHTYEAYKHSTYSVHSSYFGVVRNHFLSIKQNFFSL